MKSDVSSGENRTYWVDSASHLFSFPKLKSNIHSEVVVIGGGIAGISIAYNLSREGYKVVVVEDGQIGSGETGRTSAQLVTALDDKYYHIQSLWGNENARLIAESHRSAIDFIEQTVRELKIECLFERVDGYMVAHASDSVQSLEKEYQAALDAGLNVHLLDAVPNNPSLPGPCLQFVDQAQFHPMLYMRGLCDYILKKGGSIYTYTHAEKISADQITTNDGFTITTNEVVVATNSPVNNLILPHIKQIPYRTYVIGYLIPYNLIPKAMWWDTGDHDMDADFPPYHFVRIQAYDESHDLLICGGEDHPTGDFQNVLPEERYARLENWIKQFFPIGKLEYKWSGQVMQSMDSIGYIGRSPMDNKHIYITTGDSGTGITHSTIAAILIADLMKGRSNPYAEIYSPTRMSFRTTGLVAGELLSGIGILLRGAGRDEKADDLQDIQSGDAKIVSYQGHTCGAYRDDHGRLHVVNARCPHLKAILKWNPDEKTWDCPWHGSRFHMDGKVINGPANDNLEVYDPSMDSK